LSEGLVKSLAQKLRVSEEDAKLALDWLNRVMSEDDVSKAVSTVATIGEASGKMPETMQKTIAPVLGYALLRQLTTDPFQRQMVSLAGGLATIKALLSSDQQSQQLVEKLLERIDNLNEQIQQMREAKTREELESFTSTVTETVKSISDEVSALKKRIEELSSKPSTPLEHNPLKAVTTQLSDFKDAITALAETLSALGFRVVKPGEKPPVHEIPDEELRRVAEMRGYELKPKALTWDEVNRIIRERELRLKKWFKRRLEREARIKEAEAKKWESAAALGLEVLRVVRDFVKSSSSGGEVVRAVEERIERLSGESSERGVQEAQQSSTTST
jgi:uncharacterized protein YaaR (DUF327 family)